MSKLEVVKREIKKWNKETFGDIRLKRKKKAILKRIGELDKKEVCRRESREGKVKEKVGGSNCGRGNFMESKDR